MKDKDFYKLLMNKDKIQLIKVSTKWALDSQVNQIPLESYFGDLQTICKDNTDPIYQDKIRVTFFLAK